MQGKLLFEENQGLENTWYFKMILIITLIMVALFGYGCYQQFVLEQPFGSKPLSDTGLLIISVFVTTVLVSILVLFKKARLTVQIDSGHIIYCFPPFVRSKQTVVLKTLKQISVKQYSPVFEYGGWGYRLGINKKAFNVAGNWGIELIFMDGYKLLLGTQKPDEAREALQTHLAQSSSS